MVIDLDIFSFAAKSKGLDLRNKLKLVLFAAGIKPNTFVVLRINPDSLEEEYELKEIPEIVECINIAGRYALIVKIYAKNNRHLRDVIYEKIQQIDGVQETNTIILFERAFVRNIPLEPEE